MSEIPKTIQIKDWRKYNYDLATGGLFPTIGKGLWKWEVVDIQPLPSDKRFAKVTVWSYRFQREFSLTMGAWEEINCTWLSCYDVEINL